MTEPKEPAPTESTEPTERTCPWCGVASVAGATTCRACGAALAEREALGGVIVPGVTAVDPALAAFDAQPWRLPRSSPTQGAAGPAIVAAAMGGPVGLAALGGLAAVAATEYLGAGSNRPGAVALDALGRPSEAALRMAEQLDAGGELGASGSAAESDESPKTGEPPA